MFNCLLSSTKVTSHSEDLHYFYDYVNTSIKDKINTSRLLKYTSHTQAIHE